jgi:hypothetical protein
MLRWLLEFFSEPFAAAASGEALKRLLFWTKNWGRCLPEHALSKRDHFVVESSDAGLNRRLPTARRATTGRTRRHHKPKNGNESSKNLMQIAAKKGDALQENLVSNSPTG